MPIGNCALTKILASLINMPLLPRASDKSNLSSKALRLEGYRGERKLSNKGIQPS